MTDQERIELFRALTDRIREAGLGWVVDEVASLIDHGVELEVSPDEWSGLGKPKRNEVRITRREYTAFERLELLLDAVSRVVTHGFTVESAVVRYFRRPALDGGHPGNGTEEPLVMDVEFKPEPRVDGGDAEGFVLATDAELAEQATAIAELTRQLASVRAEAAR
jgi:hypothetical protein